MYNRAFVEEKEHFYKIYVKARDTSGYEFEIQGQIPKEDKFLLLPDAKFDLIGKSPGADSKNIFLEPKRLSVKINVHPTGDNRHLDFRVMGTMYEKPLQEEKYNRKNAKVVMASFPKIKLKRVRSTYSELRNRR